MFCCHELSLLSFVNVLDESHVYMAGIMALLHQKYVFWRSVTMNTRLSDHDLA